MRPRGRQLCAGLHGSKPEGVVRQRRGGNARAACAVAKAEIPRPERRADRARRVFVREPALFGPGVRRTVRNGRGRPGGDADAGRRPHGAGSPRRDRLPCG